MWGVRVGTVWGPQASGTGRRGAERPVVGPDRTRGSEAEGAGVRDTPGSWGRGGWRTPRRMLSLASIIAVIAMLSAPAGADWSDSKNLGGAAATGHTEIAVDNLVDLTVNCEAGAYEQLCDTFEGGALNGKPSVGHGVGSAEVVGWINEGGDPSQHVGFWYEVRHATADFIVVTGGPTDGSIIEIRSIEPGVYKGDVYYYCEDWDAREDIKRIDTNRCKVSLLTGEYDYSATPAMTKAAADVITGCRFTVMEDIGHFPMSENPACSRK